MAYMIVVFAKADGSNPGLYTMAHFPDGFTYSHDSLSEAERQADIAASEYSVPTAGHGRSHYAVFRTVRRRSGTFDFTFSRLRSPVYVPEACKEAARAQGWSIPGEPSLHGAWGPAPLVATYPIDPSLPLELEDGTPCEYMSSHGAVSVQVRNLREATGETINPGHYNLSDGTLCGLGRGYLRLRNRLPAAAPVFPFVSPITPAAVAAASKPLPSPEAPQLRFEVRVGLNGTNRDEWGSVADFDNGKDAAAWVKDNGQSYKDAGKSVAIVRVELTEPSVDWRAREQERLDDGTYMPMPGDWRRRIAHYYPDHFAHLAESDKRKVAFTESDSSGERDRQKVLSASEYFNRYLGNYYYSSDREQFLADMLGSSCNVLFTPLGNADALQEVYEECETNGYDVSSCMSHPEDSYSSEFHPVRVYAMGGDLTLAFLRCYGDSAEDLELDEEGSAPSRYEHDPDATWDGEGPIVARCLVWPEEKQFGRLYGTGDNVRLLRTALQAQGYREGSLTGARIAKVSSDHESSCDCDECNPRDHKSYVMPYLDCGEGRFVDGGETWLVGRPNGEGTFFVGNGTNGIALVPVPATCDHCGDMVSGSTLRDVHVSEDEPERWCSACFSESHYCDHSSVYVPSDAIVMVETVSYGRTHTYNVASWAAEDFISGLGDTPVLCSDGNYRTNAFQCRDCGEAFPVDEREVISGDHLCGSCATARRSTPEVPLVIAA